jgi:hypothetical protein
MTTLAFPNGPNQPGMSLRDYFAAHIMQGMCAASTSFRSETPEHVAEVAYMLADAMMNVPKPVPEPVEEQQPESKPAPE